MIFSFAQLLCGAKQTARYEIIFEIRTLLEYFFVSPACQESKSPANGV
jgi:hypothetical protein